MKKSEAYSRLFELNDQGVDVAVPIAELAKSTSVPESVMSFLSEYDKFNLEFISQLTTKKFYKNIVESTDPIEQAKGLSSFITHLLIEIQNVPESKELILHSIDVVSIMDNLKEFIVSNDTTKLTESVDYVRVLLKKGE